MTKSQAAAYVFAQAVCALSDIEAMKAANAERAGQGLAQAYGEEAFADIANRYGIHHNAVVTTLNEAWEG